MNKIKDQTFIVYLITLDMVTVTDTDTVSSLLKVKWVLTCKETDLVSGLMDKELATEEVEPTEILTT